MYFGLFDTLKPLLLGDHPNVTLSFLLGWGVTITAGLMSYPIGKLGSRVVHSHWSRDLQILCSDWLLFAVSLWHKKAKDLL